MSLLQLYNFNPPVCCLVPIHLHMPYVPVKRLCCLLEFYQQIALVITNFNEKAQNHNMFFFQFLLDSQSRVQKVTLLIKMQKLNPRE